MNIDVREYLRINPISVHEPTLSGNGRDCFLYFPEDGMGYEVKTQAQMFSEIRKAIFQNMLDENGRLRASVENDIVVWSDDVHLSNNQFVRYVRNHVCDPENPFQYVWKTLYDDIEKRLSNLENGLQDKIDSLLRKGILDYPGAVELQGHEFNLETVSRGFEFSRGFIWCHGNGRPELPGADQTELGNTPLKHQHVRTKAEAMTVPFAKKKGGSLIGRYCVGNKILVSTNGRDYHIGQNVISPLAWGQNPVFTYPLYGQNVLDWRTPNKLHNNIPPCCNIMVKYKPYTEESVESSISGQHAQVRQMDVTSAVETKYDQSTVSDLEEFTKADFTDSDLLLRISSDDSMDGNLQLMKQTLKVLLDIFVDTTEKELSVTVGNRTYTLEELVRPKLDRELVLRSEFLFWYNTCMKRLAEAERKIQTIGELTLSVPVLPYVGKIIISTTDDTEKKVISHYGGKKWVRIVNFLRGVVGGSDEILGRKMGEEYVCLRESNIPIHTHDVQKTGILSEPPEKQDMEHYAEWMCRQRGGTDKKMVSIDPNQIGSVDVDGIENVQMGYQISPLEYGSKNYATIPHNNMPPYLEVYIWKCLEITEYEEKLVGKSPVSDM